MNIVSYRGPGKAGGVSSTLRNIWDNSGSSQMSWWYIDEAGLQRRHSGSRFVYQMAEIPEHVIEGHYKYCNNFLWPVMHDMPEHAIYSNQERRLYKQLNWAIAKKIGSAPGEDGRGYFLQDYQFALMPSLLEKTFRMHSILFWHIPWPAAVKASHKAAIAEIASSLLQADAIGFHTQEYADNFANFVKMHLPQQYILLDSGAVELLVAPLGIDVESWTTRTIQQKDALAESLLPELTGKQFILSVDRADYTKGVVNRLNAIDRFYEQYPQYVRNLTFVQICGRTRPGLAAFDKYWQSCQQLAEKLNARWSCDNWSPLLWITEPVGPEELALLYRDATIMLVNPIRDGLNLTAKEAAACQGGLPAALLLSRGAGVWHELGIYCKEVDPSSAERFAGAIQSGLTTSHTERKERALLMKDALGRNNLNAWWSRFAEVQERREHEAAIKQLYTDRYSSAIRSLLKS